MLRAPHTTIRYFPLAIHLAALGFPVLGVERGDHGRPWFRFPNDVRSAVTKFLIMQNQLEEQVRDLAEPEGANVQG
jgi:hypothetical protein